MKVLAVKSFLADIAQNVAGNRLQIETLMPLGMDPHAFDPTPQDVTKIAAEPGVDCQWGWFGRMAARYHRKHRR